MFYLAMLFGLAGVSMRQSSDLIYSHHLGLFCTVRSTSCKIPAQNIEFTVHLNYIAQLIHLNCCHFYYFFPLSSGSSAISKHLRETGREGMLHTERLCSQCI